MKLHMTLPMLVCFLSGIALDMSLSRITMDIIFIAGMVAIALVLTLIARKTPKKKLSSRSQSKVVNSRKAAKSRS